VAITIKFNERKECPAAAAAYFEAFCWPKFTNIIKLTYNRETAIS
jgi:hypothetical protein